MSDKSNISALENHGCDYINRAQSTQNASNVNFYLIYALFRHNISAAMNVTNFYGCIIL